MSLGVLSGLVYGAYIPTTSDRAMKQMCEAAILKKEPSSSADKDRLQQSITMALGYIKMAKFSYDINRVATQKRNIDEFLLYGCEKTLKDARVANYGFDLSLRGNIYQSVKK